MAHEILVPKGTQWREPVSYEACDEQVRIVVAEDSIATVELLVSGDIEVLATVSQNASLTVVCIQTQDATIKQTGHIGSAGSIHWQNISLAPVVHTLVSHVEGGHAISNVDWMFYAREAEQQTISATNAFAANNGGGEITLKGIAEDTAHVQCNGCIDIGLRGGGTQTYLTEDVLMLDNTAKVDAIPGLEIKTNDVQASHSATVSKVTPEDLFYFGSRGIDTPTARQMYIQGFIGDLTQRISHDALREKVIGYIEEKCAVV